MCSFPLPERLTGIEVCAHERKRRRNRFGLNPSKDQCSPITGRSTPVNCDSEDSTVSGQVLLPGSASTFCESAGGKFRTGSAIAENTVAVNSID